MFDLKRLATNIRNLKSANDFENYLESSFFEIEEYFESLSLEEIDRLKFDFEDLLYDLEDQKLILQTNSKMVNAFLILLAQKFEQAQLIGAITLILGYLPNGGVKKRLEATKLYLKVNDISKDYFGRFETILTLLENSAKDDDYNIKAIYSLLQFYRSAFLQFLRVQNESLAISFRNLLQQYRAQYRFLQDESIAKIFSLSNKTTIQETLELVQNTLLETCCIKISCKVTTTSITKEVSTYSQTLYSLQNPTFTTIRNIAFQYIQSVGDTQALYDRLKRGEAIIDDEVLLYRYLVSFGAKHKAKLYSSYDAIFEKIKGKKFNIIDWGCGQAMATMLLLNYTKEKNITLDIENIILIEPSSLALSRGLLHLEVLKQKNYTTKAINSDLDCLKQEDLVIENGFVTLHLFSNILDIDSFKLDNNFLQKISDNFKNDSIFVCVSPNRNDKLNSRLDLFFNYFNENFDTELIASRDDDIENATRYEKVFEVKYIPEVIVEEKREELKVLEKEQKLDIIDELSEFSKYVVPILDMKILENSINNDPEYAIYKIRKVAEVLTSNIYLQFESNGAIVSFNDKIRYLSYEKKLFDKTITNYVHTLRTIGNRGVHENAREISKLKLDAYLMTIALVSFLKELVDKKLI